MDDAGLLEVLKLDLQLTGTRFDVYLMHLLRTAAERIAKEGITLAGTPGDDDLRISYAAWLYRSRATPDAPMPKSLRWGLNNRLLSEKGAVKR